MAAFAVIGLVSLLQESATRARDAAQNVVMAGADWVRLALETAGVVIIAIGGVAALSMLVRAALSPRKASFTAARLKMGRYLALALEFQLAADILTTAIAPAWQEIGQLAAIVTIRTALNYFLSREIRQEREQTEADGAAASFLDEATPRRQGPS
jgi:uncharacterized membrane protein